MFTSFYLTPAAFLFVGVCVAEYALRQFGASLAWRRTIFVALVTVLLAPALVPAATIMTVWVPNGLLALRGEPPLLFNLQLVRFAALSFFTTGLVAFALSLFLIRRIDPSNSRSGGSALLAWAATAGVAAVAIFYSISAPVREIAPHTGWVLLESIYGRHFDELDALGSIANEDEWTAELDRLRQHFEEDPLVASLSLSDQRLKAFHDDHTLYLRNISGSASCSTTGRKSRIERTMHCARRQAQGEPIETLRYQRVSIGPDGEQLRTINIEFHIDALLKRYPADNYRVAVTADERVARELDYLVEGEWIIRQRSRLTVNERVEQTGVLVVGPRSDFGTYPVTAKFEVASSLRPGKALYSRPECGNADKECVWEASATGTLRIRGKRVLIVYDDYATWLSDRLDLNGSTLVGRDPWGSVTIYERPSGHRDGQT